MEDLDLNIERVAREVVEAYAFAGKTIATAESCTAGMVASALADVPGASSVLRGGAVTYCDEIKHRVLGVSEDTLDRFSAVSDETAREMAVGSRDLFQVDVAVSLTGYAGPGGGSESDPVGTVYIGVAAAESLYAERCTFEGTRTDVRKYSALHALELLLLSVGSL